MSTAPRKFRQLRYKIPERATEILLVRHGESQVQVEGEDHEMLEGQADPCLSDEGRAQAAAVCERLAREHIDAVVVTPLRRTSETAAGLAGALGLEPRVEPDLREVFLGEWESKYRQKVIDGDPIVALMYEEQRWDLIPGAEATECFEERVKGAIERIAGSHPGERVAVFAHGGTIGAVLAMACSSERFAFIAGDNASVSRIVVSGGRWHIRSFNDTSHLADLRSRSAQA